MAIGAQKEQDLGKQQKKRGNSAPQRRAGAIRRLASLNARARAESPGSSPLSTRARFWRPALFFSFEHGLASLAETTSSA